MSMPELQQPNVVGNFLSSYYTAQQKQQADADRQRNMQRQDVADERQSQQFDMQMDLGKIQTAKARTDALNQILSGVDPANEQSLIMAKQRFIQDFKARPEDVAHITMADIPRIKMQTGQTAAELDLQYKRAQIGEVRSRAAKAKAEERAASLPPGMRPPSNEQIDNEAKVRGEYTGQLKDFVNVRDAFGRVAAAAEDPSAAGDLALIFNYMKMLDPGSVVREQEFANAQNAAGVPERIRAAYNNAIKGERLTDNTRADFLDRAGRLFSTQLDSANKTCEVYGGLADQYGFARDRVTPDLSLGVTSDIIRPRARPTFTGSGVLGDSQGSAPVDLQSAADAIVGIKR